MTSLLSKRESQKIWIKERFKKWQMQWHELFDEDQELAVNAEFDRPDPLPDDIDGDFRLIFGFSNATAFTRQKCFSCFPNGQEMSRRFEQWMSSKPKQMQETEVKNRLGDVFALIDRLGINEETDFTKIKIVDRDTDQGMSSLCETDDITVLFERPLPELLEENDLLPLAARLFLTEPLYASAGNFYHLRDWVTSAMFDESIGQLYFQLCELWKGGWQILLDNEGVVLAHRKI